MPHVNQLIDKYGSQGFYVVGVTGEPEDKTLEYIATTKSKAIPSASSSGASMATTTRQLWPCTLSGSPR